MSVDIEEDPGWSFPAVSESQMGQNVGKEFKILNPCG